MIDEILINTSAFEVRTALLAKGQLQELFVERNANKGQVGNIYCGKVVRVLPGMQAAFIDIGFERTAFLHIGDIDLDALNKSVSAKITDVLRPGQLLNVQIIKDPIGTKGARLSTCFSLASHYFVYMPHEDKGGISQRIEKPEERSRLQQLVSSTASEQAIAGGFIVRTAAEGADRKVLQADMSLLVKQWQRILSPKLPYKIGGLIYQELPAEQKILRDAAQGGLQQVLVDNKALCLDLKVFADNFLTEAVPKISYYDGQLPIFDRYSIEAEINQALLRRVELKSGGYVIFDQTEAMITVDVNSGAYVGNKNLEETAYATNLEAALVIAQQLRIRNLGGIIMIDFIDMHEAKYRHQVNLALDKALSQDREQTARYAQKELGLVALTRKRNRESLAQTLCDTCLACDGKGQIRSLETLVGDIFRQIYRRKAGLKKLQSIVVIVSTSVGEMLMGDASKRLMQLEVELGVTIKVQIDAQFASDHFDVILL